MKKFYGKHGILLFRVLTAVYIFIVQNVPDPRSPGYGKAFAPSMVGVFIVYGVLALYLGLWKRDRGAGVLSFSGFMFFLPLLVTVTMNIWRGIARVGNGTVSTAVGLARGGAAEEILLRGLFLDTLIRKNVKCPRFLSAGLFSLLHLVNYRVGSPFDPVFEQMCYTFRLGLMLAVIVKAGGGLAARVSSHRVFNRLSAFAPFFNSSRDEDTVTFCILCLCYARYINFALRAKVKRQNREEMLNLCEK